MRRALLLLLVIAVTFGHAFSQTDTIGFLFNKFEDAIVYFKNRGQLSEKMNYNMMTNSFYFIDKQSGKTLELSNAEDISSIRMANRSFILEKGAGIEVLPTTPPVYVQYRSTSRPEAPIGAYGGRSETTSTTTYNSFQGSDGRRYELEGRKIIAGNRYNVYWVEVNGKRKKFISFKQLLKIYSKHKDVIEAYIKENNVDFNNAAQISELCVYAAAL